MEVRGRYSKQRETIYSILCDTTSHPSVDEIYQKAREIIPDISLGTVYRNLNLLAEQKRIIRLDVDDRAHYDARVTRHFHFVCKDCGEISDLFLDEGIVDSFISNVERVSKNKVDDIDLMINGICKKCKEKGEN